MIKPGFILVHGYSGAPRDLALPADHLAARFGPEAVHTVCLPGHEPETTPPYDRDRFVQAIAVSAEAMGNQGRQIVLVGHSTGGTLALDGILQKAVRPAVLVLAATPHHLDGNALTRWEHYRADRPAIPLGDVARMVSHINRIGSSLPSPDLPLLIVHGARDPLVPPTDAAAWQQQGFCAPVQSLIVPEAGHDLFAEPGGPAVIDWIIRRVEDRLNPCTDDEQREAKELATMENVRLRLFFRQAPQARGHVGRSPGARRALGEPYPPLPQIAADPIQLNVEVTTHCNIACPHCARTVHPRPAKMMGEALFHYLLDLQPNAYRVVLVGLGEPTMHPRLADLVAAGASRGRWVGLVTNSTLLTQELSRSLIAAGVAGVTFSLDCVDPFTASAVRPGAHVARILDNIREFTHLSAQVGIATAVFTAVSARTVLHLPQLADTIGSLGVQAWMLSDLNFIWNQPLSLGQTQDPNTMTAVRQALRAAFAQRIPVLNVDGLEAFALAERYRDFLLYPPSLLARRGPNHTACLSPWQTLPVDVEGHVTCCDCRPRSTIGNLLNQPFSEIWNGEKMQAWRRQMVCATPPADCGSCPRF